MVTGRLAGMGAGFALTLAVAWAGATGPVGASGVTVPDLGQMARGYRVTGRGAIVGCPAFVRTLQAAVPGGVEGVCTAANFVLSSSSPAFSDLPVQMDEFAVDLAKPGQAHLAYLATMRYVRAILAGAAGGPAIEIGGRTGPGRTGLTAFRALTRKAQAAHVTGAVAWDGTVVAVLLMVGANTAAERQAESRLMPAWAAFFRSGR